MYDENQSRGLWRLGRIVSSIEGTDGDIRGACVRVLCMYVCMYVFMYVMYVMHYIILCIII